MHKYAAGLVTMAERGELTPETLGRSIVLQFSTTKMLELVGENAWQLEHRGYELGPAINLRLIASVRHRIVHGYDGVDWNAVEEMVFVDIPQLVRDLEAVMAERGIERDELDLGEAPAGGWL